MLDTGDTELNGVESTLREINSGEMGSGMETRKKLCCHMARRGQSLGSGGGVEVERREWTQVMC